MAHVVANTVATSAEYNAHDDRLTTLEASIANATPWLALTLGTNVTYLGSPYARPAYRISGDGQFVYLRGLLNFTGAVTTGATVATLGSSAASPPTRVIMMAYYQLIGGTGGQIRLDIGASSLALLYETTASTAASAVASLDGMSYCLQATV